MFEKSKIASLLIFAILLLSGVQCGDYQIPEYNSGCAAVTCPIGTSCQNGKCITRCKAGEVNSPLGCIQSCSSPEYQKCDQKFFPLIYDPKFCAYNAVKKTWASFTFACQACGIKQVSGFFNGKCPCSLTGCQDGYTCNSESKQCEKNVILCSDCKDYEFCSNGKCADKCQLIKCSAGYTCEKGQCIQNKCNANVPKKVTCERGGVMQPCPPIYYIRAPDPVICGVDKDGKRTNYVRRCEACGNKSTVFYYDVPCKNIPETMCQDNEECIDGKCVNQCALFLCKTGTVCMKGVCIPIAIEDPCSKCSKYQVCVAKKCVNKCQLMSCENCKNGQCPTTDACQGKCKSYERCFQGKCRDNCDFLKCANCVKGVCGVNAGNMKKCEQNWECGWYSRCQDGKCVAGNQNYPMNKW